MHIIEKEYLYDLYINQNVGIKYRDKIEDFINWMYSGDLLELCLRRKYRACITLLEYYKLQNRVIKIIDL